MADSSNSRPWGQGERGDEGIQGVRAAADPPFQGISLGALRRGPLGRAILAVGLLSLLASYVIPFALTLRVPANEKQAPLPLLQAPAFQFPTIDPAKATPAPTRAREAAPGTTPAPSSKRRRPDTQRTFRRPPGGGARCEEHVHARPAPEAEHSRRRQAIRERPRCRHQRRRTSRNDGRTASACSCAAGCGSAGASAAPAPVEHVEQTPAVDTNAAAAAAAIAALQAAIDAANAAAAGSARRAEPPPVVTPVPATGTGTAAGEEDTEGDETITPGDTSGGDAIVASSAPTIGSNAQAAIAPSTAAPVYDVAPVYVAPAPAPVVVDDELEGIEVTPTDSTPQVQLAPADLDLPAITTETATDAGGPAASDGSSDGTAVATPPATGAAGGSAPPTAADPATGSAARRRPRRRLPTRPCSRLRIPPLTPEAAARHRR